MIIAILIPIVLLALKSLFTVSFYTSHDGFTHVARIAAYFQALSDGQFPPRWAERFAFGLGSPIFTYIYPLPYALGSLFHYFGISFQDSFRLIMTGATLLSALAMFVFLKPNFGKVAALVGAIFYVWVPYRFLNLYVRAAFAENLAYTLLPISFLCIQRMFSAKKIFWWWYGLTASLVFMLLSHNVVSAMFLPVLFLWAILEARINGQLRRLPKFFLAVIVAFLASSFIYAPDLFERGNVWFDEGISYYKSHFVSFWQLIRSPWGYGFDFEGTVNDAMSFQLGLTQIAVLFGAIYFLIRGKLAKNQAIPIFFVGTIVVSIFLLTLSPLTLFVWEHTPVLKTIVDFPWRFLGVTTFGFSVLAAFVVSKMRFPKLAAAVLIVLVMFFNRNHLRINEVQNFPDSVFESFSGSGTATSGEFTPKRHNGHRYFEPKAMVETIEGSIELENVVSSSLGLEFDVSSTDSAIARINRLYFPQTRVFENDKELSEGEGFKVTGNRLKGLEDDSGLIEVVVGPQKEHFRVVFEETPLRLAANLISFGTFGLLGVIGLLFLLKKRGKIS